MGLQRETRTRLEAAQNFLLGDERFLHQHDPSASGRTSSEQSTIDWTRVPIEAAALGPRCGSPCCNDAVTPRIT